MSKPVQITSGSYLRDTLKDYDTVFVMFYKCSDLNTRAMLPIFESLCEEHSASSIAFVKVKKDDLPGLCAEHRIPRSTSLTFAAFKKERKVEMINGTSSEALERLVQTHIRSTAPRARGREHSSCDCCNSRARACSAGPEPEQVMSRPRRAARSHSRHRVSFVVDWPARRRVERDAAIPADLTYIGSCGPLEIERPMQLEYPGRDGRQYRTDDVRLQRTATGAEATYLDRSGPIAIERTIGR